MPRILTLSLLLAASVASAQLEAIKTLTPEQGQDVRQPIEAIVFSTSPEAMPKLELELLEIFQSSETTLAGKQYTCRMLRYCASEASVPVLAPELGNPVLAQFVRRVFQSLETPDANEALIAALPTVGTEQQIGIIGTLGQRGSENSVEAIAPYLESQSAEMQFAAITALGDIGGEKAVQALTKANPQPALSNDWKLARMEAARSLSIKQAANIFMEYRFDKNPQIQAACLIGITKLAPKKFTPEVLAILESDNPRHRNTAIGLLPMLSTAGLIQGLGECDPENQVLLINELADRKATTAETAILALTKNENVSVRDAAFQALENLGETKSIQPLLVAAIDNPVAYESLCGLNAPGCDAALIQTLETSDDEKVQSKMIECLTARQAAGALPAFVEIANGDWSRSSKAAIDGMADLIQMEDFQCYAELIQNSDNQKKTAALEKSIIVAAQRFSDKNACAQPLIAAYGNAAGEAEYALVRVLGGIGGEDSRVVLTQALTSSDPKVQDAAVRGLANWPTLDAADQLLEIATAADSEKLQVLALRGYIRLAYTVKDPSENLAMCENAAVATDRPADLKSIIGCVKQHKNKQVLDFLTAQLDNPAVATEAGWAICEIARQRTLRGSAKPILEKLAQSPDAELAAEAQKILKR
ncbi:HEAT repeat domain-containing protein [Pontiellaceae bacterium B1224]|nr:HEAT repeat domain-containing protein [Pontiellaceae bacterium B1224]